VKRLTVFSIRSFVGPFVVTFLISMFMLIMQFTWKYIDDLMGKGLGAGVITELLFYVSAGLIPLALPLAILLSSIMTFGNLAENNELTALKSSGMSLFRIMRPLMTVVFFIALGTFYFANYVIPVANLKWHSLIFDIQETKVAALITPGSYSKELDGYAIKVEGGHDNSFTGITIHDYTDPTIVKTIKADSGTIFKSTNGEYLFFRLINGRISEELNSQPPIFQPNGMPHHGRGAFRPSRRTSFAVATYKMDLTGFNLNRSDQDMFKDEYEMLNVFQINDAKDSMQKLANATLDNFVTGVKNDHPFFQSLHHKPDSIRLNPVDTAFANVIPTAAVRMDTMSPDIRMAAINHAITKIRRRNQNLDDQHNFMVSLSENNDKFAIEFHRKFALTVTIIVLFFVGAPLGAIVRKGGFGAPVVIAALLFMLYFVLFSIGENLANEGVVSPFWGMWMPTVVLTPVAFILMISAANDLSVFDRKLWRLILSFGRRR
jgi:lipopolysaccharide export system permease protein